MIIKIEKKETPKLDPDAEKVFTLLYSLHNPPVDPS